MNTMKYAVLLVAALALVVSCSDETTGPADDEGNGGPITYGFAAYRFGTEFYGIWSFGANDWIGVGADGQIMYHNNGKFYSVDSGVLNHFHDVWASARNDVFVVGDGLSSQPGVILHFDGTSWSAMSHPSSGDIRGVYGLTSTNVYAVTTYGEVLHYDGTSWAEVYDRPSEGGLFDVWCESLTNVIAVGENGGIVRWDGGSWSDDSVIGSDFTGVWGSAYNNIYVCGGEQIWRYDGSWGVDEQSAGWSLEEIHGSGPNDVWAVGPGNDVVHWDGTTWSNVSAGGSNDFHAVWAWSGTNAVLLSDHGGVYRYDGADWNEINDSEQGGWQDMHGLSPDAIYAVSGRTLMFWDGSTWAGESNNIGYNLSVWCAAQNSVYTCGWPGSGAPRYVYYYDGSGWAQPYQLDWTMPYGVWGVNADTVYAAWEDGVVAWMYNGSWSSQQVTAAPVTLGDIWGVSGTDVFVAGAGGTVVRLQGTVWNEMTTGVSGAIDLSAIWGTSATDVVAVGEAGTIIRYDGAAWSAETSPVSTILTDVWADAPDNYWVVGTSGVVLHYNGTEWARVPSGLNEEIRLDCVWGSGGIDVWVGGDNDYLMHWEQR
jgi:hypothetical protein